MSWKPEFKVYNEEKFYQNGQNFATKEEAEGSALRRYHSWMMAEAWKVVEVDSEEFPVNYTFEDGQDKSIVV